MNAVPPASSSIAMIPYHPVDEEQSPHTGDSDLDDILIDFPFVIPSGSDTEDYESLYSRSSKFCFDSSILVPPKKSDELYTRELFSLNKAIEENGGLEKYRIIENNFDIYIFDKKSYLVWNNGPQKGHIYRVLTKNETLSFQPLSQDEFRKCLDAQIQNPNSRECAICLKKSALDLFESKHGDYHLWDAQYFTFPGQDESIIDLFTEIQNLRFGPWLMDRYGINSYRILDLRPEVHEELVPNKSLPKIFLTHGTFSDKLASIIQLGGLAGSFYADRLGIKKIQGGESGGSSSWSSCSVSFWEFPKGNGWICPGFGVREGFEYPITFSVGENHYKDHNSYHALGLSRGAKGPLRGGMAGEATVNLFWPIECIDYIFVPPFAVKNTSKLLEEHGLTHIEVFPYTRTLS